MATHPSQNNIAELHVHLRQFQISIGLAAIASTSSHLWQTSRASADLRGEPFGEWMHVFLAQELIRVGRDDGDGERLNDGEALVQAVRLGNGLIDRFQFNKNVTPAEGRDQIRSFWYRRANEQFWVQNRRSKVSAK